MTFVNSGRLVSNGIPQGHFTHIFMDEAGHSTEPEAMIPLALMDPKKTRLILAGDPKQLGPILRSKFSLKYGLQVSLLERLMTGKFPQYEQGKNLLLSY